MSKDIRCGNCKHFKNEDGRGKGWCEEQSWVTECSKVCKCHEPDFNGWTEITPDNVDDALKAKEMLVIAHYADKRLAKEILPADVDNNQLEKILSTMAELGGYYCYVLPELKIE